MRKERTDCSETGRRKCFSAVRMAVCLVLMAVLVLPLYPGNSICRVEASGAADAMVRVFNPATKEHLYTKDKNEEKFLGANGWIVEGVGWFAPTQGDPVYRVFNRDSGEHFYTTDANEKNFLVNNGAWNDEGIGWFSDPEKAYPVYRLFNAAAGIGAHHYTTDAHERSVLLKQGWKDEGIGWYAAGLGYAYEQEPAEPDNTTPGETINPDDSAPSTSNVYDPADGYAYSVESDTFHYYHCPSVKNISSKNLVHVFVSRDTLRAKGLKPCERCNP